jgi:hypothetical protein
MEEKKGTDIAVTASGSDHTSNGGYTKNVELGEISRPVDVATEEAIDHIEEEYTIDSDNSPYPEVRANVPNTDDPDLPVSTFRMWLLGIVFTMVSRTAAIWNGLD